MLPFGCGSQKQNSLEAHENFNVRCPLFSSWLVLKKPTIYSHVLSFGHASQMRPHPPRFRGSPGLRLAPASFLAQKVLDPPYLYFFWCYSSSQSFLVSRRTISWQSSVYFLRGWIFFWSFSLDANNRWNLFFPSCVKSWTIFPFFFFNWRVFMSAVVFRPQKETSTPLSLHPSRISKSECDLNSLRKWGIL